MKIRLAEVMRQRDLALSTTVQQKASNHGGDSAKEPAVKVKSTGGQARPDVASSVSVSPVPVNKPATVKPKPGVPSSVVMEEPPTPQLRIEDFQQPQSGDGDGSLKAYRTAIERATAAAADHLNRRCLTILEGTDESQRGWEYRYLHARASPELALSNLTDVEVKGVHFLEPLDRIAVHDAQGAIHLYHAPTLKRMGLRKGPYSLLAGSGGGRLLLGVRAGGVVECLVGQGLVAKWKRKLLSTLPKALFAVGDGTEILVEREGRVEKLSARDGKVLQSLPGGGLQGYPSLPFFSMYDGSRISTHRIADFSPLHALEGGAYGTVRSSQASSDERLLLAHYSSGVSILWGLAQGKQLRGFRLPKVPIRCGAFHTDHQLLALGGEDGGIRFWDLRRGSLVHTLRGHRGSVSSLFFSHRHPGLVSLGQDRSVRRWPSRPQRSVIKVAYPSTVSRIAFYPDGERLLVTTEGDGTRAQVEVMDAANGERLVAFEDFPGRVTALALSKQGKYVATGLDNGAIRIWKGRSGALVRILPGQNEGVEALSFSPDGERLVSGGKGAELILWNTKSGSEVRRVKLEAGPIRKLRRLRAGGWMAVCHKGLVEVAPDLTRSLMLHLPGLDTAVELPQGSRFVGDLRMGRVIQLAAS
jgi:WD40 repeat protein